MSTASRSVLPLSLPGATSHHPSNGLNIAQGPPSLKKRKNLRTQGYGNAMTINALTVNALVEIFDFCRRDHIQCSSRPVWKWHLLAHVCRRWRQIIFASPRRLHLEILCTDGTPVRKDLGIWPAIPIVIQYGLQDVMSIVTKTMSSPHSSIPIAQSFQADSWQGSAPCLREIEFTGVPFPALPTLLLSASGLVELRLCDIPKTGYISPEVMVAHLATLPKLQTLHIGFLSPHSHPGLVILSPTQAPTTRAVLPALNHFSGVCDYLEDFVARIDAPQLRCIEIYYLDDVLLDSRFDVPRLSEFVNRSENLKRTLSGHCQIIVDDIGDAVDCCIGTPGDKVERRKPDTGIYVYLQCDWMQRKISHLTRMLNQISPILSDIIHFAINSERSAWSRSSLGDLDYFKWLHFLRPFSSVQTLFVAAVFAGHVSFVLRDTVRLRVTDVLPALELLCIEDKPVSYLDELIAVRRDSGRPLTIINSKEEFEKRLEAYPS
ncbi:hypothetical protein EDB89DRAFT_2072464 [Lactarius sanguifluus]|nr:hypothetical protein EDB89DRAFT_2072464 [Lactarius sanguifluus]